MLASLFNGKTGNTFGVSMQAKNLFFDRPAVQSMMDRKTARAMPRAGAFIRRKARGLIGKPARRPPPRPPGSPVRARSKNETMTIRNIQFAYDPHNRSMVVGPVRLNGRNYLNGVLSKGTIPALHEFGGSIGFREKLVAGKWVSRGRRSLRPGQQSRIRTVTVPARPFMRPAMEAEIPKFPLLWASQGGSAAA